MHDAAYVHFKSMIVRSFPNIVCVITMHSIVNQFIMYIILLQVREVGFDDTSKSQLFDYDDDINDAESIGSTRINSRTGFSHEILS